MLGHRASLNKFKSIKIISSIFSDHIYMKLEINHRKEMRKKNYMETNPKGNKDKEHKGCMQGFPGC